MINWLSVKRGRRETIAIDGKTICGSGNEKHRAYHVISAFVAETQLTPGEITVEEKSNEIIAVPELLELIDVEGCIVTADAMSCQKKIVKNITEKDADYTIGLKQNQSTLFQDTKDYFETFSKDIQAITQFDKGHGRIEKREYRLLTDIGWLEQRSEWSGLKALGMVRSTVTEKNETREYTRALKKSDLHWYGPAFLAQKR